MPLPSLRLPNTGVRLWQEEDVVVVRWGSSGRPQKMGLNDTFIVVENSEILAQLFQIVHFCKLFEDCLSKPHTQALAVG